MLSSPWVPRASAYTEDMLTLAEVFFTLAEHIVRCRTPRSQAFIRVPDASPHVAKGGPSVFFQGQDPGVLGFGLEFLLNIRDEGVLPAYQMWEFLQVASNPFVSVPAQCSIEKQNDRKIEKIEKECVESCFHRQSGAQPQLLAIRRSEACCAPLRLLDIE